MSDKYPNYQQLASSQKKGDDYQIRAGNRDSNVLVFAPHGGSIEPGTSEIVTAIAGEDLSYYVFEGIKSKGNGELHITSTNFDEPTLEDLLGSTDKAIALHGERGRAEIVYIGGLDIDLGTRIESSLNHAGFDTARHENPMLQGTSKKNVCNRCLSGSGIQLELSKGLRQSFFESLKSVGRQRKTPDFCRFVAAIRRGIKVTI